MVEDVDNKRVGRTVAALRGPRSQQAVADAMQARGHKKWSQSTVWSVEKGSRPLRLTEAADLARVLDVDVKAFLEDSSSTVVARQLEEIALTLADTFKDAVTSARNLKILHTRLQQLRETAEVRAVLPASPETAKMLEESRVRLSPEYALVEAEQQWRKWLETGETDEWPASVLPVVAVSDAARSRREQPPSVGGVIKEGFKEGRKAATERRRRT